MSYTSMLPTIQQQYRIEGSLSMTGNVIKDLHRISVINVTEMDPEAPSERIEWNAERRLWDFLCKCLARAESLLLMSKAVTTRRFPE